MYEQDQAYIHQKVILQLKMDNELEMLNHPTLPAIIERIDSLTEIIHEAENKQQFFQLETQYRTQEKEAEIQRKEIELQQSRWKFLLLLFAAILIVLVAILIFILMKNKQKRKELEQNQQLFELQHSLQSLELSQLNKQLNPHEIKNLITSIAPELILKAPDTYKKLIKLFNVTRASLNNELTEDFQIQIRQAEDFLQLQQSISPYPWTYQIEAPEEDIHIEMPRLILKNAVENAVKHGLKSVKLDGHITIKCTILNNILEIKISDNGIGLKQENTDESTGIGLKTYQKLFQILNAKNEQKASIELLRDQGLTTTLINIPIHYQYQISAS